MQNLMLILLFLLNLSYNGYALKCYSCSVTEFDVDQRCVTNPDKVEIGQPIINCDKKYCTSIRQDYIDPKGKVVSMTRGCEDKPVYLNTVVEDGSYRIYFRACQKDLCNDGSGYDTSIDNAILDQDMLGVIYTKGSGGTIIKVNFLSSLPAVLLCSYYYMHSS